MLVPPMDIETFGLTQSVFLLLYCSNAHIYFSKSTHAPRHTHTHTHKHTRTHFCSCVSLSLSLCLSVSRSLCFSVCLCLSESLFFSYDPHTIHYSLGRGRTGRHTLLTAPSTHLPSDGHSLACSSCPQELPPDMARR